MANLRNSQQLADIISRRFRHLEERIEPGGTTKIVVPQGVVSSIAVIEPKFEFVSSPTLRRNLAYTEQILSFYGWIFRRFKTYGPVEDYLYKTALVLYFSQIEALIIDFLKQRKVQPGKKTAQNLRKLVNCGVSQNVCDKIREVHQLRGGIHLATVNRKEVACYTVEQCRAAHKTLMICGAQ